VVSKREAVIELATCDQCDREMTDPATTTCKIEPIRYPDGRTYLPISYRSEAEIDAYRVRYRYSYPTPEEADTHAREGWPYRCHDCKVVVGGVHHPGCDAERCPVCSGQLIGCGCLSDDEED
jgi:hypothetical protein